MVKGRKWFTHCTRCGTKLRYGPGGGWQVIDDDVCLCAECLRPETSSRSEGPE